MSDHFTGVERRDDHLRARCAEHGTIGRAQEPGEHGLNAVITEARAHDDVAHGVYRTDEGYRRALHGY